MLDIHGMQATMLYISSMLIIARLASSNLSNVRSALPYEQDECDGQEEVSEGGSRGKVLMPYLSRATHDVFLARAVEHHVTPSTDNKAAGKRTFNLRVISDNWTVSVPLANAVRGLSLMYQ